MEAADGEQHARVAERYGSSHQRAAATLGWDLRSRVRVAVTSADAADLAR